MEVLRNLGGVFWQGLGEVFRKVLGRKKLKNKAFGRESVEQPDLLLVVPSVTRSFYTPPPAVIRKHGNKKSSAQRPKKNCKTNRSIKEKNYQNIRTP